MEQTASGLGDSHLVHMSCTKLHGNLTIATLAEKCPKTIYNLVALDLCKHSCKSTKVQGAESKTCTTCI